MLKQYTFSYLVGLNITKYGIFSERYGLIKDAKGTEEKFGEFYLALYLKNIPSLKKLQPEHRTVSLNALDEIHASYPLIQTLELDNIELDMDYILQKYTNLQYLYLNSTFKDLELSADLEYLDKTFAIEEDKKKKRLIFHSKASKNHKTLNTSLIDDDCLKVISEFGMNIAALNFLAWDVYIKEASRLGPLRDLKTLRSLNIDVEYFRKALKQRKYATPELEVLNMSSYVKSKLNKNVYNIYLIGWTLEHCALRVYDPKSNDEQYKV
ncbi:hypothetical protein K501DRAFT_273118 [Backusella circina FSU 941]|nr:hypothetical protein K501DRAFT_273118 [Backusella circina FSU 941]